MQGLKSIPVPSPNLNPKCNSKQYPLDHKQLWTTMHTVPSNVYRTNGRHMAYHPTHAQHNKIMMHLAGT